MAPSTIGFVSFLLNLALSGGLFAVWLRYRIMSRNENRVDFSTLLAAIEKQRDEAWAHIRSQDVRIEHLEAEIQGLRIARDLDPFPQWLVDLDGRYTFVNRPFEEVFLAPERQTFRDMVGKTDDDIWPAPFCKMLKSLDIAARKRSDGTARATASLDIPALGPSTVTVHKFPCRIKGVIVAYAGYMTAIDPENVLLGLPK